MSDLAATTTVPGQVVRRFMRRWPGGITIVTTAAVEGAGRPVGCTVTAFLSVSLRPPMLLVSLAQGSRTLVAVQRHRVFAVNILAGSQRHLADRFAGAPAERFDAVPYSWQQDVPVLDETVAAAVCRVDRMVPAADHVLVLGVPQWCRQDETASPVVIFDGSYHALLGGPTRQ